LLLFLLIAPIPFQRSRCDSRSQGRLSNRWWQTSRGTLFEPGAAAGLRTVLVRTGKFRQETLAAAAAQPDAIVDSIADVPAALRELA
jgi:hypothetical protein